MLTVWCMCRAYDKSERLATYKFDKFTISCKLVILTWYVRIFAGLSIEVHACSFIVKPAKVASLKFT